jgi:hypothetical protein
MERLMTVRTEQTWRDRRTFKKYENVTFVAASVRVEDTAEREQLKREGFRFDGLTKEWTRMFASADLSQATGTAQALLNRGYRVTLAGFPKIQPLVALGFDPRTLPIVTLGVRSDPEAIRPGLLDSYCEAEGVA